MGPMTSAVGRTVAWTRWGTTALAFAFVLALGGQSSGPARAAGTHPTARLELSARTPLLRVEHAAARHPLAIDAFVQKGGKLTGGGVTPGGQFGWSVSLSADGTTALVGGDGDSKFKGAA